MSSDESVRDCAARLERDGVTVDVLVNNAGVLQSGGILDVNDELMRQTLEVNLLGPLRTARAFMPGMLERGYGRVVNVSSGAGSLTEAAAYSPAYSISKAALNMLTRQLAFAAEGHGDVKVNAMCRGGSVRTWAGSRPLVPSRRASTRWCGWQPCPPTARRTGSSGTGDRPPGRPARSATCGARRRRRAATAGRWRGWP